MVADPQLLQSSAAFKEEQCCVRCLAGTYLSSHSNIGSIYLFPFKTYLRNALNDKVRTTAGATRNDIYALCDLVYDAYKRALTYVNIVSGFLACGLWFVRLKRPLPEVSKLADITKIGEHAFRDAAFKYFLRLTESFTRTCNRHRSDEIVAENGTLYTKAGAFLRS